MTRSFGSAGFDSRRLPVASARLVDAVAASLAFAAVSLCLAVTITVCSIGMGMPGPV